MNSYALTLASFLLTGGRVSDVWSARPVFILGLVVVGAFSLGIGFVKTKAAMFVLRALSGIGASLTIPAALRLIVYIYPEPDKQAIAIAVFGGVSPFQRGSLDRTTTDPLWPCSHRSELCQTSSGFSWEVCCSSQAGRCVPPWRQCHPRSVLTFLTRLLFIRKWIFWFAAIVALLLGILAFVGIPTDTDSNRFAPDGTLKIETSRGEIHERKPKMDYLGTFLQTAAIVLFICKC